MVSIVNIYNMAILHLGTAKTVASTSESSKEARICNVFYEQVLDEMLARANWSFAAKVADGQLVAEDPNDEWGYAYLVPSDCVTVRRVLSGTRRDTRQTETPFRVMNHAGQRVIMTDEENAQIEYTMRVTNTALFPANFSTALSFGLAARIAPALTEGDKYRMKEFVLQLEDRALSEAFAHDANQETWDAPPEAESIRERGAH